MVNPPPPPDGSTRVAAAPPAAAPPAADPNARPTTLQGWADKLLTKPLTKDAQGNDVHGQSPLEKLADAFKPSEGRAAPQAPAAPMMMAQDPDPGLAPGPPRRCFKRCSNPPPPLELVLDALRLEGGATIRYDA